MYGHLHDAATAVPAIQLLTEFKHSASVSIPSGAPTFLDQLRYSINGVELTPQFPVPTSTNTHSARVFRQLPTVFLPKRTVNPRPRSLPISPRCTRLPSSNPKGSPRKPVAEAQPQLRLRFSRFSKTLLSLLFALDS